MLNLLATVLDVRYSMHPVRQVDFLGIDDLGWLVTCQKTYTHGLPPSHNSNVGESDNAHPIVTERNF
jgi:hypothetical protein